MNQSLLNQDTLRSSQPENEVGFFCLFVFFNVVYLLTSHQSCFPSFHAHLSGLREFVSGPTHFLVALTELNYQGQDWERDTGSGHSV